MEITYTGIELRADDDETGVRPGAGVREENARWRADLFTFYEICMDLGWSINGRYYKKAEECLTRLQASAMQFSSCSVSVALSPCSDPTLPRPGSGHAHVTPSGRDRH